MMQGFDELLMQFENLQENTERMKSLINNLSKSEQASQHLTKFYCSVLEKAKNLELDSFN